MGLVMACQPTTHIGFFFFMAVDAKSHEETILFQPVHGLNLPMALLARDFLPYVPLVIEKRKLGHIVHFDPRCGGPFVKIRVLFLDPWMLNNHIVVAIQTLFHRRNPRES